MGVNFQLCQNRCPKESSSSFKTLVGEGGEEVSFPVVVAITKPKPAGVLLSGPFINFLKFFPFI